MPWIDDYELFKYFSAIVETRQFKLQLEDWAELNTFHLLKKPKGLEHVKLLEELNKDFELPCLVGFFDICSHKPHKPNLPSEAIEYNFMIQGGKIHVAVDSGYKSNEEYAYTYITKAPNHKLIFNYGFYLDNNPFSYFDLAIVLTKQNFQAEKYKACRELRCLEDTDLKSFYKSDLEEINLNVKVYPNKINNEMLNFIRLYIYDNEKFSKDMNVIIYRLHWKELISYENELKSLTTLRDIILKHINNMKISYIDTIIAINETRKYFKDNRDIIVKNDRLRYTYRLRRKLMMLGLENYAILYNNLLMINNKLRSLMSDQFQKIRDHY
jgi:hypothetical protein